MLERLLEDPAMRDETGARAAELLHARQGATARNFERIFGPAPAAPSGQAPAGVRMNPFAPPPLWSLAARPLAALYRGASAVRAALYRRGSCRAERLARPVVSVGNLTVGGTGKTPVTAWLARELTAAGFAPPS